MKIYSKFFILVCFIFLCVFLKAQTPINDKHWEIFWQDEFSGLNYTSPDPNKWLISDWAIHGNEPQLYKKENVFVKDGNLVITIKKNPTICPENPLAIISAGTCKVCEKSKLYSFTSGFIDSKQGFNTQFGFIEARIKQTIDTYGLWNAFWTYWGTGITSVTGYANEIDIFEFYGGDPFNKIPTNAWDSYTPAVNYPQVLLLNNFNCNVWHKYGIEWSPSKIIWYVDDVPVRTFTNHNALDPVRIIFNIALHGIPTIDDDKEKTFYREMLIDYIRVYKLNKDDENVIINSCNYDFTKYNNKVKKEIIIGVDGCDNVIPNNQSIYLRSTDGVLLNNLTVPLGSELYIDVNKTK